MGRGASFYSPRLLLSGQKGEGEGKEGKDGHFFWFLFLFNFEKAHLRDRECPPHHHLPDGSVMWSEEGRVRAIEKEGAERRW